jgi:hypothetical protein
MISGNQPEYVRCEETEQLPSNFYKYSVEILCPPDTTIKSIQTNQSYVCALCHSKSKGFSICFKSEELYFQEHEWYRMNKTLLTVEHNNYCGFKVNRHQSLVDQFNQGLFLNQLIPCKGLKAGADHQEELYLNGLIALAVFSALLITVITIITIKFVSLEKSNKNLQIEVEHLRCMFYETFFLTH